MATQRNWKMAHRVRRRGTSSSTTTNTPSSNNNTNSSLFLSPDQSPANTTNNNDHSSFPNQSSNHWDRESMFSESDGLSDILDVAFDEAPRQRSISKKKNTFASALNTDNLFRPIQANNGKATNNNDSNNSKYNKKDGGSIADSDDYAFTTLPPPNTKKSTKGNTKKIHGSSTSIGTNLLSQISPLASILENNNHHNEGGGGGLLSSSSSKQNYKRTTGVSHIRQVVQKDNKNSKKSKFLKISQFLLWLTIMRVLMMALRIKTKMTGDQPQDHLVHHYGPLKKLAMRGIGQPMTGKKKGKDESFGHFFLRRKRGNSDSDATTDKADGTDTHVGSDIPIQFENIVEIDEDEVVPQEGLENATPLFWHISRSGGSTVKDVLGYCMHLSISASGGHEGIEKSEMTKALRAIKIPSTGLTFVNVDTHQPEGIARAKDLGLAKTHLSDIIFSRLLLDSSSKLFSPDYRGRLFTLVRHPIYRAASWFHHTQDTKWRRNNDEELKDISMEEYFKSGVGGENNYMVRHLSDNLFRKLTNDDLNRAKEVMRRKILVGLLDEKSESMDRFIKMFKWKTTNEDDVECYEKRLQWAWSSKHRHDDIEEGSEIWNLILEMNTFDMQLYDYAKELFVEQGKLFTSEE